MRRGLASRGMKWIQCRTAESMDDSALRDYLRESRRLVILAMPKKARIALNE
jgi:predicted DNA-binding protein (MmcQ/YjbR family)